MSKRLHVLCDIDHCLADSFWRDPMIGGEGGWDAYHSASPDDKPAQDVVDLINELASNGYVVMGLTARPEKWRRLTMDWLVKHRVALDGLLMRGDTDYRPAAEIKGALALAYFGSEEEIRANVLCVLDDREDVITSFCALGVTAIQVHIRRRE